MGLGNNTGRFTFVNIKKGQLAIKKDGDVHLFDNIEGKLIDLEIRDDEYQGKKYKKLCLMLNDGKESFQLQMKLDSGYGYAFCSIILNADLKAPMRIVPTYKEIDNKGKAGMFINQNGKALKWYYTRDTPHDLPLLKQTEFKGQVMWDNTDQQNFFYTLLLEKIRPQIIPSVDDIVSGPAHELDQRIPNASEITEPIDDLPF